MFRLLPAFQPCAMMVQKFYYVQSRISRGGYSFPALTQRCPRFRPRMGKERAEAVEETGLEKHSALQRTRPEGAKKPPPIPLTIHNPKVAGPNPAPQPTMDNGNAIWLLKPVFSTSSRPSDGKIRGPSIFTIYKPFPLIGRS